jgi:3-oxoacyl-[acyl-carrier-protein] synthase-3
MINISRIYYKLGGKIEQNSIIEKEFRLKKDSICRLTGINKRFISTKNETSEKLALEVCKSLKTKEISKISHIISVTNTPSIQFPGISNYVCNSLNLNNVHCINLNSGCTGYVDALILAYDIINFNKKSKILIVTADTYSKYINKNNKSIRPLFSDGSSASIIHYAKNGFKSTYRRTNNVSNSQKDLIFEKKNISMNGPAIVSLITTYVIPELKKNSRNVDGIYLHQAGKIAINLIKANLYKGYFVPTNFEKYGNLVSTSIPVLLKENLKKFKESKKILICGFGVGLSMSLLKLEK